MGATVENYNQVRIVISERALKKQKRQDVIQEVTELLLEGTTN